jgi:hypothetical protein
MSNVVKHCCRDSSVGIATLYGLNGPGIESRCEARFSAPVQRGPEAHPASYTMGTESFPGAKRPGRGLDHPPQLAPRLKKVYSYTSTPPLGLRGLFWGELYLYYFYYYYYYYYCYYCYIY